KLEAELAEWQNRANEAEKRAKAAEEKVAQLEEQLKTQRLDAFRQAAVWGQERERLAKTAMAEAIDTLNRGLQRMEMDQPPTQEKGKEHVETETVEDSVQEEPVTERPPEGPSSTPLKVVVPRRKRSRKLKGRGIGKFILDEAMEVDQAEAEGEDEQQLWDYTEDPYADLEDALPPRPKPGPVLLSGSEDDPISEEPPKASSLPPPPPPAAVPSTFACAACAYPREAPRPSLDRVLCAKGHLLCKKHNVGLRIAARAGALITADESGGPYLPRIQDLIGEKNQGVRPILPFDAPLPECPSCTKESLKGRWPGKLKEQIGTWNTQYFQALGLELPGAARSHRQPSHPPPSPDQPSAPSSATRLPLPPHSPATSKRHGPRTRSQK
ncbi:hypothetical protein, partial [Parasphingorhabdus sp.]